MGKRSRSLRISQGRAGIPLEPAGRVERVARRFSRTCLEPELPADDPLTPAEGLLGRWGFPFGVASFPARVADVPFRAAGFPEGAASFPFGAAGFPTGVADVPFGVAGLPAGAAGFPLGAASFPTRSKVLPLGVKGLPSASTRLPPASSDLPQGSINVSPGSSRLVSGSTEPSPGTSARRCGLRSWNAVLSSRFAVHRQGVPFEETPRRWWTR